MIYQLPGVPFQFTFSTTFGSSNSTLTFSRKSRRAKVERSFRGLVWRFEHGTFHPLSLLPIHWFFKFGTSKSFNDFSKSSKPHDSWQVETLFCELPELRMSFFQSSSMFPSKLSTILIQSLKSLKPAAKNPHLRSWWLSTLPARSAPTIA